MEKRKKVDTFFRKKNKNFGSDSKVSTGIFPTEFLANHAYYSSNVIMMLSIIQSEYYPVNLHAFSQRASRDTMHLLV